ncbi:hypothetical protein UFOVP1575_6 [uncultured Caudovirales phage]|uniref:Uncharacterized protein n=1 Tax=uncultured Caudovirales phage TaxID=2100421 RepID=A0A6J5SNT1_9CAUD|nr:hypothetical protein UFOVP1128_37 [uncultured Caudovirales phage]CAB4192145.1 hypothetical protein UFOVP1237_9 [uncultured Caudovirales phage]CAB4216316.1 hypothetical protein UFOVP1489_11 [uncultured Caudovirales phage]CAB5230385.1 hypothetical protein UFOVP1575_6 [uncultured Caudovirales phage]
MAAISGISGNVSGLTFGGVIKNWTANLTRATVDVSAFGNPARNRVAGIVDITGSFSGTMDSGTSPTNFLSVTSSAVLTLTAESGNTIAFSALIESCSMGVAVDGEATVNYTFALANTQATLGSAVSATWS